MAHDVFISHSSKDASVSRIVRLLLESKGLRCWISSRDIPYGMDWTEAIVDGIARCRVLVLILSSHSNESSHVKREVQLAAENGVPVFPLRIEDCQPSKKLQYYITGVHWLDAIARPIEPHLEQLAVTVQRLLASGESPNLDLSTSVRGEQKEPAGSPDRVNPAFPGEAPVYPAPRLGRAKLRWSVGLAGAGVLITVFAWFFLRPRSPALIIGDHISVGEEIILSGNHEPEMKSGVQAYARGEYDLAVDYFDRMWRKTRDEEALIYLNNAQLSKEGAQTCTIAVVVPVSRTGGPSGYEILKGVAQAQREVNQRKGRIKNGVGLKIAVASDVFGQDNDFSRATEVAKSLAADPQILGVIGHFSSDVTKEVIPIYQGKKTLISSTSTAQDLIPEGTDPKKRYIFRTVYQDSRTAQALANCLIERTAWRDAAVFYAKGSVYSESLYEQFQSVFKTKGGRIPDECVFDLASAHFVAEECLAQAIASKVHVLVFFPNSKTVDNAIVVLTRARQPAYSSFRLMVSGDSMGYNETLQMGRMTEGLVSVVPWHWQPNSNSPFYLGAKELWPADEVVWQMALSYDAVHTYVAALADHMPPDAMSVQKALASRIFSAFGATGEIHFDGGDRIGLIPQLVQVKKVPDSPDQYQFIAY